MSWTFFAPVMIVGFVIVCVAVIGLMLNGKMSAGRRSNRPPR